MRGAVEILFANLLNIIKYLFEFAFLFLPSFFIFLVFFGAKEVSAASVMQSLSARINSFIPKDVSKFYEDFSTVPAVKFRTESYELILFYYNGTKVDVYDCIARENISQLTFTYCEIKEEFNGLVGYFYNSTSGDCQTEILHHEEIYCEKVTIFLNVSKILRINDSINSQPIVAITTFGNLSNLIMFRSSPNILRIIVTPIPKL